MWDLVLCSASARRKWIFEQAGYSVIQRPSAVEETLSLSSSLESELVSLAKRKRESVVQAFQRDPKFQQDVSKERKFLTKPLFFVAADTEVVFDHRPLGKPADETAAKNFLSLLSGEEHSVITAVSAADLDGGKTVDFYEETRIQFRSLEAWEVQRYIDSEEWKDKAGGYAIQGLGGSFVTQMRGDLLNVIGFPLRAFEQKIRGPQ